MHSVIVMNSFRDITLLNSPVARILRLNCHLLKFADCDLSLDATVSMHVFLDLSLTSFGTKGSICR